MGAPVAFPAANKTLSPPAGEEDRVQPMQVYTDGRQCVSYWELSPAELEQVALTGRVYVNVWSGGSQPPIYVWAGKLSEGVNRP